MRRLVAAELLKLGTARAPLAILAAGLAAVMVLLGSALLNAGKVGAASLGTTANLRQILVTPGVGALFLLVVGVLAASGEFRHHTATGVFLVTPRRIRVVMAKVAALALIGLGFAAGSTAMVLAIALPYLALQGVAIQVAGPELALVCLGTLAALPLYAVLGVGIGALIPNQVAAVLLPVLWLLVVENLLPAYGLARLVPWLPGGAASALARTDLPGLLPMWVGGLLLVGYTAAFVLAGARRLARLDIA
jgi:ABC-2 type transport system permease protein